MDKDERRAYLRWLDSASSLELEQKLLALEAISYRLTEDNVISEFNWMKKEIFGEIDARNQAK